MTKAMPLRTEIPVEHTWDASSIFSSDDAWEAEIKSVEEKLNQFDRFKGQLSSSAATLADCFDAAEEVIQSAGKIIVYANMFYSVDTGDQSAAAKNDRGRGVYAKVFSALSFMRPEMLDISIEQLNQWMREEPRLAHRGLYFEQLENQRPHIRSGEVEALLSQTADVFRTANATHGILSDADLKFKPAQDSDGNKIEIGQGNIRKLISSEDRQVRKSAWENYADGYLALKNTMANCISAGVKRDVFSARARNYSSSLEAALKPNHLPLEVFHNLVNTFKKNLPTWQRYWRIRREALGYDELHVYDTRSPLTAKITPVSFDQSMDWICEGMKPLGDDYVNTMKKGVYEDRWVDIYPNKNKRMGAFSSGVKGTHPFIMMSHSNDLMGLSTLAHELGHSMHSYSSWQNQPQTYSSYTMFVAEVASNFNQALVRDHLLKTHQDPQFQIQIIEEAMSNFHRYFMTMPTLARFELEIHERIERGEALTADSLIELMADLFSEVYGSEAVVDRERVGIIWAQFATHLYANFYVFQYATGISGAHALAHKVINDGPEAAENYLKFLSAGSSVYPLEALKIGGVDLSTPEPVETTFEILASYVDKLEELLGVSAAS